ncbi:MAG: hypothetical protein NDJ90_12270, partial [Oligoflexia bacterium]|nr:hypothetical protein [Oligoflexia bacterium]
APTIRVMQNRQLYLYTKKGNENIVELLVMNEVCEEFNEPCKALIDSLNRNSLWEADGFEGELFLPIRRTLFEIVVPVGSDPKALEGVISRYSENSFFSVGDPVSAVANGLGESHEK